MKDFEFRDSGDIIWSQRDYIGMTDNDLFASFAVGGIVVEIWDEMREIKPKKEKRWIWLKDLEGRTLVSNYHSDEFANATFDKEGWYKSEMFIEVEV